MKKPLAILLTGRNGQVGYELERALAPLGEVTAFDSASFDLRDPRQMEAVLSKVRPDVIVNPAAYTAVDKAESDRETAFTVNAAAPGFLAGKALELNALLVHYSTDYVFDGSKHGFYCEEDVPNPFSVYGETKLAGEQAIMQSGCRHLIFRTTWVYGIHGNNFAKTMLRLARDRSELRVVADQWGAPTPASLLADVTAHVFRAHASDPGHFPGGLFHLVPQGVTTWRDYAQFVIDEARQRGMKLQVENITPITTAEFPTPARRPANSRLDSSKIRATYGLSLPDWRDPLRHSMGMLLRNL
ncbi:MAG: dTDP-4-dehydrorhamnose reductase [Verrucomicrobiota bacterium]